MAVIAYIAYSEWRTRPSPLRVAALAVVTVLVASPIAWVGYLIVLLPVLIMAPWRRATRIGAVMLCVPDPVLFHLSTGDRFSFIVFGSFYAVALLLIAFDVVRGEPGQSSDKKSPQWSDTPALRPVA